MTAYECFEKAEEVENITSEIYRRLSSDFASDPKAKLLFSRLAEEEAQHAARLALFRKQNRADSKVVTIGEETKTAIAEIHAFAVALSAEVFSGSWGTDFQAVCRKLSDFEDRLGAVHAERIAAGANSSAKAFFKALAQQDRVHRDLLKLGGLAGR